MFNRFHPMIVIVMPSPNPQAMQWRPGGREVKGRNSVFLTMMLRGIPMKAGGVKVLWSYHPDYSTPGTFLVTFRLFDRR